MIASLAMQDVKLHALEGSLLRSHHLESWQHRWSSSNMYVVGTSTSKLEKTEREDSEMDNDHHILPGGMRRTSLYP